MYPRGIMSRPITMLGAGHMGYAILAGAIRAEIIDPSEVTVVDVSEQARKRAQDLGCTAKSSASEIPASNVLILAVRPQEFSGVAKCLHSDADRLAISIMAGLTSNVIAEQLGSMTRVVRAMPNAPASINKAITTIAAGQGATESDVAWAKSLFSGIGSSVEVEEAHKFATTAVSGSGPAWAFSLAAAIFEEGVALGLPPDVADKLTREMIYGAAALLVDSNLSIEELVRSVVTPGGTTEAGLAAMSEAGMADAIRAGVRAACRRGEALASQ